MSHRSVTANLTTSTRRWEMVDLMSVFRWPGNNCLGSLLWHRHLPWNIMMKFQGLLSACSLEVIQSCFFRNLTTPSFLVTPLTHPSSSISICRISATISLSQRSMREERLLINLLSLLTIVQSSKMYLQMLESFTRKGPQDVKSYGRVSVTTRFLC